jgi:hypothetical protein
MLDDDAKKEDSIRFESYYPKNDSLLLALTKMSNSEASAMATDTPSESQTRRRLVEHIDHHELVDALPYADHFDATLKVSHRELLKFIYLFIYLFS